MSNYKEIPPQFVMWGQGQPKPEAYAAPEGQALTEQEKIKVLKTGRQWNFALAQEAVEAWQQSGNTKLAQAAAGWLAAKAQEEERLRQMLQYERPLWDEGVSYIAGVDEVGRGPIAGPVVAAAVILPPGAMLYGVNDSKQLSEAKRLELEAVIKSQAIAWAIGAIGVEKIDRYNILQASMMAMEKALRLLPVPAQHVLIDAVRLPRLATPQTSIIKGDAKSASIAAASILAKCHRDKMMKLYDGMYPGYGLAQHSGYPTPSHKQAVFQLGYTKIHRRSFVLKPPKQK